ncbi:MAG: SpaA isopeptide-forming pilin-related protein [Lachnospiraceae bacterium]|nr:SpaA isopeptide-forming pilin-related protein [Lachnospiraceae bacterium]
MKKICIGFVAMMTVLLGMASVVHAEPVEDEAYTFMLNTISDVSKTSNPTARTVDTDNLRVTGDGVVGSENSGWDGHFNSVLKYVVSDGNNQDMEGRWRMIYCLEYKKFFPNGILEWDWKDALDKKITYCMFYGCRYWGQTSVWPGYSTGDWKKDYWATQWAIHILNGEVSMEEVAANAATDAYFANAMTVVRKMVNDANSEGNYGGFEGKYYTNIKFGLDRTTASWSATSAYNNQAGYTTEWITPQLSDGYSASMREYVRSLTSSSDVDGISVIKEDTKTMSRFRLWMSEATYKNLQKTGKTIKTVTSAEIPMRFGSWRYNAYNENSQDCTLLEMNTSTEMITTKMATIISVIPGVTDRTIAIEKVDAANEGMCIAGARMQLSDAAGKVVAEFDSKTEPYIIEHVLPGTYTLTELTPPPGYGKADPMTITVTAGTEVVTYKMKDLKYCDVTVIKKIPVTDTVEGTVVPNITWAHGNPTFFFRVEGVDLFGQKHCYIKSAEFTREYVEQNTKDGYTELACTFSNIPQGPAYRIQEEKVARYKLKSIDSADDTITISEAAATADLVAKPTGSRVRFTNEKYRWDKLSHNDVIVNKVKLG